MNKETLINVAALVAALPILILSLAINIATAVAPIVIAIWVYNKIFG